MYRVCQTFGRQIALILIHDTVYSLHAIITTFSMAAQALITSWNSATGLEAIMHNAWVTFSLSVLVALEVGRMFVPILVLLQIQPALENVSMRCHMRSFTSARRRNFAIIGDPLNRYKM